MGHEQLMNGKYYHIYNRGNNRCDLFLQPSDYEHFLGLYDKYISPVAETLAWVLMPNHFHLLVKIKENMVYRYSATPSPGMSVCAISDNDEKHRLAGTAWFEEHRWETVELSVCDDNAERKQPDPHRHFAHLFNAYSRYLQNRTGRTGNLFERPFKRKQIGSNRYLQQIILYIHNNPVHHGFCSHPLEYPWSSYLTCISKKPTRLKRDATVNLFGNEDNFKHQHSREVEIEPIEKRLDLKTVDYYIPGNVEKDDDGDVDNGGFGKKVEQTVKPRRNET